MFLAKQGEYESCGIFTIGHLILMTLTIIGIILSLKYTINKKDVHKIIKRCTIFIWVLEILIIIFKISRNGTSNIND